MSDFYDRSEPYFLCKIDPHTNVCIKYNDYPEIKEHAGFMILNNDLDDIKYENIVQILVTKNDDNEN